MIYSPCSCHMTLHCLYLPELIIYSVNEKHVNDGVNHLIFGFYYHTKQLAAHFKENGEHYFQMSLFQRSLSPWQPCTVAQTFKIKFILRFLDQPLIRLTAMKTGSFSKFNKLELLFLSREQSQTTKLGFHDMIHTRYQSSNL